MSKSRNPGGGPSQRQLRVGEAIRRQLAEVLQRGEVGDPEVDAVSVTVSEVRASPDLRHATAYVLPLGGQNADGLVRALERNKTALRRLVTSGMALKYSPELGFAVDETFDRMDRTRALLESDAVRRDLEKD